MPLAQATAELMVMKVYGRGVQAMSREATKEVARDGLPPHDAPRRTKFTPENIRQIINLVERGKRKEEIAEIIGVTTGTLQVTCSKLGISLRQPRFDTGTGMLRRRRPGQKNAASSSGPSSQSTPVMQGVTNALHQPMPEHLPVKEGELSKGGQECGTEGSASVNLVITMHYRGKERTSELPFTQDMIGRLALEAEFRGIRTSESIAQLIAAVIEQDMVEVVLGQSRSESLEIAGTRQEGSRQLTDGGNGQVNNGRGSL
jgi:hypothetical protein